MNQEFDKYHDTYNDMLEIVRNKYILGVNYSFKNGCRTHRYREPLNEETVKRVYVMFCKYLFENAEKISNILIGELLN